MGKDFLENNRVDKNFQNGIQPCYLGSAAVLAIKDRLKKEGVIQLHDFLNLESVDRVRSQFLSLDWKEVYVPDLCKYANANLDILFFHDWLQNVFKSSFTMEVRAFSRGDYLLRPPINKNSKNLSLWLDLSKWNSKEGGWIGVGDGEDYLKVSAKSKKGLITIPPRMNSLSIIKSKPFFVKYVTNKAKYPHLFLVATSI